jgi:hypothetical protein
LYTRHKLNFFKNLKFKPNQAIGVKKTLYHLSELPNHSSDFEELTVITYTAIAKKIRI